MPRPTFFALPDDKRDRVIDAAILEFAAWPYGVASLDRIASAARVSKGSLYQYFDDKRDVYAWLVTEHLPARKRAGQRGLPDGMFVAFEGAVAAGLLLFREQPALASLAVRVVLPAAEPEVREVHAKVRDTTHSALRALVVGAQASGEVRTDVDPDIAADLISALMGVTLLETVARRAGIDVDTLVRDPGRALVLSDATIAATVRELTTILRRAIGAVDR
jgi:AcrR family transcriptional regulator